MRDTKLERVGGRISERTQSLNQGAGDDIAAVPVNDIANCASKAVAGSDLGV